MDAQQAQIRLFTTLSEPTLQVAPMTLSVPLSATRHALSDLVNHLLTEIEKPLAFDFLVQGELLRDSLADFLLAREISLESVVSVQYILAALPPRVSGEIKSENWILAVSVSPALDEHRSVAYGDPEGTAFVCDIEGENSRSLSHHDCAIQALTWIDSGTLVVGSKDASVSFWKNSATATAAAAEEDNPEWTCIKTVACQDDSVAALANYKDPAWEADAIIVSGGWDNHIRLWKVYSLDKTPAPKGLKRKRSSDQEGKTRLDPQNSSFGKHGQAVTSVCFAKGQQGVQLWSGSWDHTVKLWDPIAKPSGEIESIATLAVGAAVNGVSASPPPSAALVAVAAAHGLVAVFDPRAGAHAAIKIPRAHRRGSHASGIAWHPSSPHHFASCGHDGAVRIWDMRASDAALSCHPKSNSQSGNRGDPRAVNKLMGLDWCGDSQIVTGGSASTLSVLNCDINGSGVK